MYRRKLRTRLLAAYLIPSTLAMLLIATAAYFLSWRSLEQSLGERLKSVALGVTVGLRPDDATFLQPGDEKSRTYGRVRQRLEMYRDATGVRRVILFDLEGQAIADSEGDYAIGTRIADLSRDRLEVDLCLSGHATSSRVLFTGTDGLKYKTGYAPLFNEEGNVVAGVAVDGSAAFFDDLSMLGQRMFMLGILGLCGIVLVSFFFSRSLTRPVSALAEAAERIGAGDLGTSVPRDGREDEIGLLAESLEGMRIQLEARQRELQMMLAGIAHEVRNPLGGMELFSGLLAEDLADDPEKLSHINRIRKELGHLGRLVTEFLDYARERPLDADIVHADKLVSEVADLLDSEARGRGIEIIREVEGISGCSNAVNEEEKSSSESGLSLYADAGILRRALLNLARNAVQATLEGGRVIVGIRKDARGFIFYVSDDGPGISPKLQEKIFEPFYTTREKGSGLGLALVRKAAEVHGGRVSLGRKESGALFELWLPEKSIK